MCVCVSVCVCVLTTVSLDIDAPAFVRGTTCVTDGPGAVVAYPPTLISAYSPSPGSKAVQWKGGGGVRDEQQYWCPLSCLLGSQRRSRPVLPSVNQPIKCLY